jgi:hypothetical protein
VEDEEDKNSIPSKDDDEDYNAELSEEDIDVNF